MISCVLRSSTDSIVKSALEFAYFNAQPAGTRASTFPFSHQEQAMIASQCRNNTISALLLAALLAACGGGSDSGSAGSSSIGSGGADSGNTATGSPAAITLQQEPGAPAFTGNTALDGFNWTNFRRKQTGLPELTRNSLIDVAAQGHSRYQQLNNTITHVQTAGQPGFTGATLLDRLNAAGYTFGSASYAYGEVIAAASDSSGFYLAEELVTAIYHRFVMFEPIFKESGTGAATVSGGYTYFTNNFATNNGFGAGISQLAVYPYAGQSRVPTVFFSDQEEPDPVPNQNEVGYPISVHANFTSSLNVDLFTVRPRGGATMAVRLLTAATDVQTRQSGPAAAAIIALTVLDSGTIYDVSFRGQVDGVQVDRDWSFTTQ
jgi:uncharacterized protein YkwD